MVEVWLPYGNTEVPVRVKEEQLSALHQLEEKLSFEEKLAAIEAALDNPLGTQPLAELAIGKRNVAIVVSRFPDDRLESSVLDGVLRRIHEAKIEPESVKLIFRDPWLTRGSAKWQTSAELDDVSKQYLANATHESGSYIESKGLRVAADVLDAELRIALGMSTSNPFMLWDGAWSGVAPGLLDAESQSDFLRLAGTPAEEIFQTSMLKESRAVESKLEFDFELNLLTGAPSREHSVLAGEPTVVHKEADRYMADRRLLQVKERADVVLLSPGGAPLDRTLFAASDSALVHPDMTRRGGAIVLVAACEEAYGPDEFYNLMRDTSDPSDLARRYGRKPGIVTLKALLMSRLLSQNTIVLISTLPDYYVHHVFGLRSSKTAGGGLLAAERSVENISRVVVIRHGSAFASKAATQPLEE